MPRGASAFRREKNSARRTFSFNANRSTEPTQAQICSTTAVHRDHSLDTSVPLESMSAPKFKDPGTCVAQRDKKQSQLHRISLRASECNRWGAHVPPPVDLGHRRCIVGPTQDMMSLQERKKVFIGREKPLKAPGNLC